MKILLILSHWRKRNTFLNKFVVTSSYPTLTLEQLVSVTPDHYEVDYVDERWQTVDVNWDGDLVGISTLTLSANHAYEIADEFRRRGKTVVLGGYHPSAVPEEAKQHADAVVIGEAEISWPRLLADYEHHELKPFYRSDPVDPAAIPSPKRLPEFRTSDGIVQATRGCPYRCKFCAVQNVEGAMFRTRPVEKVIEEIKSLQRTRFLFADSSLTINSTYTKQLFQEMAGLNVHFSCYGNIDVLNKDEELLKLAHEAGCEQWLIGFESVNQETLKFIGKKTNKVEDYAIAVKKIKGYGMTIMGLFMFGFDTDTNDVFDSTLEAVYKMDLERAGFAIVTPYPGTPLFDELEKEGRILTRDWSQYNLRNVVFQPKNMSVEELRDGRESVAKEYYSFSNCLRRGFQDENIRIDRLVNRIVYDYFINRFYRI